MVRRPALSPGAHLTRHDARRLRIGSHPGVVVDDSPLLRALVRAIDGVQDQAQVCGAAAEATGSDPRDAHALLDELVRRGAVVDADPWLRVRAPRDEVVAAVLCGRDPAAAGGRARTGLVVHAAPACHDLADLVRLGARIGGVSHRSDRPTRVQVVVTTGEPHRETIDALACSGSAVLPVTLAEGRCVVGPWIERGRTPCLRCADLSLTAWDAGWSGQWPSLDRADRPHGVGVEVAQATAALVVADVLAACDRGRPRTVGARFTIGPEPARATRLAVGFDPECPCHLLALPSSVPAVS
ncbi:hypothetical protein [Aeromicrobium sp. Leaf350]|uniref:hypothetical protein n=1 Tax=Aeromicrobium sp. Leaf350 TaxID=2876565 RepID=UPI001E5B0BED|nr:hypothetical protein [Aeromicrobium sp. Leaf350]